MLTLLRLILGLCISGNGLAASLQYSDNPETGLGRWILEQGGLHLELAQRLPDQTRAFFIARGFPAALADTYARACVFQTIARNIGATGPLSIDTGRWRVRYDGIGRPLMQKAAWLRQWREAGLPASALLAFRWATFPREQRFQPGDYNWGMIGFGPAPGEEFDLELVWRENDETQTHWLRKLRCAEDR